MTVTVLTRSSCLNNSYTGFHRDRFFVGKHKHESNGIAYSMTKDATAPPVKSKTTAYNGYRFLRGLRFFH
jgi:hypothetical protein